MDEITCNTEFSNGTLTVHIGGAIDHHTAREARETADKAITDTGAKKTNSRPVGSRIHGQRRTRINSRQIYKNERRWRYTYSKKSFK